MMIILQNRFYSVLVTIIFWKLLKCEYITSSTLQKCYSSSADPTNCSEKIVVVLSLENGQMVATESIQASLNSTSVNGTSQAFKYPYIIEVTKSPVTAIFSLKYKQDFNNQPKERVLTTSLFTCKDGYYNTNPTCGIQLDSKGQSILDSQGYCCYCSLQDIFGFGDNLARGKICYAMNLGSGNITLISLGRSMG